MDRKTLQIRINANEKTLIETGMRREGWTNRSGYIKYHLFGFNPDAKTDKLVERADTDELAILLRNQVLDLTEQYMYIRERYERDMTQLWKEEGVDMNKWTSATNHWHAELAKRTQEMLALCRKIASRLGLDEYFNLPSDAMPLDMDHATPQEMDALAQQLRKERIAMGHPEEL